MTDPGRSFDEVPDLYDEVRPTYPAEVYDEIDQTIGGLSGRPVLDLAAGTGIVYRELVGRGAAVTAVEPSEPMLGALRRRSPSARAVAANAEALPFRAEVFELVTCATAWHWVQAGPTVEELSRVTRPGGWVALFWAVNDFGDGIEWEDAQSAVFEKWEMKRGSVPPTPAGVHPRQAAQDLRDRGLEVVVEREVTWQRTVSREFHLKLLQTHSINLMLSAEQRAQVMAEIAEVLPWPEVTERLWGPLVIARF